MAPFIKKNKIKLVLVGIFSFVLLIGWSSSVSASCSGYCGNFSDSQGCWCDTLAYGDYCSDICTYCCPSVTGCRECSTYADCNTGGWTCSGNAGNECKAYYPNSCPDGCMCSTANYYFTEESCFDKGRQCPLTEISGTICYYGRYCSGDACAFYYSDSAKPATYYSSGGICYYGCSVTCTTSGWSRSGCSSATISDGQSCTTDSCTSGGVTHSACACSTDANCTNNCSASYPCKRFYSNTCDGCCCTGAYKYENDDSCGSVSPYCPSTKISGTTCYWDAYCSGGECAYSYSNSTKPATYYSSGGTCYYSCSVTCTTSGWSRTGCSSATISDGQTCTTDSCTSGGVTHSACVCSTDANCNNYCSASYPCKRYYPNTCDGCCCTGAYKYENDDSCGSVSPYCPSTKISGTTCYWDAYCSGGECAYSSSDSAKPDTYYSSGGNCYWNCSVSCVDGTGWVRGTCSGGPTAIDDGQTCTTDSCTSGGVTHSACACSTYADCNTSGWTCSSNPGNECKAYYQNSCPDGCCCSDTNYYFTEESCFDQGNKCPLTEISGNTCYWGPYCSGDTCAFHYSDPIDDGEPCTTDNCTSDGVTNTPVTNNTQVTGCNGVCQACQGGVCSTATAGTDPGDKCITDYGRSCPTKPSCQRTVDTGLCGSGGVCAQTTKNCPASTACYSSSGVCYDWQQCDYTDFCSGNTRYSGKKCDASSVCNVLDGDIGCCQGNKCPSGQYCDSSTYSCTALPECKVRNENDFGYSDACTAWQTCVAGSCHNTRVCSDTCQGSVTDTALCSAPWYCVYNGTCYASKDYLWGFVTYDQGQIDGKTLTCHHHSGGDSGRWINTDYYIDYCTSKGWHWNVVSGDARVEDSYYTTWGSRPNYCYIASTDHPSIECCCGDDAGENYRTCDPVYEYVAGASCGTGANAEACCDSNTDCVDHLGNCVSPGACYPFDGKYGYCHVTGNSWQDPDASQSYCEHATCPNNYKWTKSGESVAFGGYAAGQTTEECCEDDSGEYKTTEQCPGATATSLCCSAPGKKIGPANTCIDVCCQCTSGDCCDGCNFRPSTYVCRPAGTTYSADCDIEEKCDSFSATCPTDVYIANGTACTDDGDPCTNDICSAGACTHPSPLCSGTDTSCGCFLCSNCNGMDYLTNVGNPYTCCNGNYRCTSCQDQEYKDYYCSGTHCVYIITTPTLKSGCSQCDPSTFSGCLNGECIADQVSATKSITIDKPASIGTSETGGSEAGSITISNTLNMGGTDTHPAYLIYGTEIIMVPGGQIFLSDPISGKPTAVIIKAGRYDNDNTNFGTIAGICAYYNNITCELSGKYCYEGNCISCHQGNKCPAGNYCRESDHSCQPVPDCQVRNETGYGTSKVTDNTQASGCNNVCQACQNGACGYATAQTDPGEKCPAIDCTKYLFGFFGGCCYRFLGSSFYNGNCNVSGQCSDNITSCSGIGQYVGCCDSRCIKACPPGTYCPAGLCSYEITSNRCYTSGQQGCPSGYYCDFGGICTIPF